jgi:peptide/nickel transport system permease protein
VYARVVTGTRPPFAVASLTALSTMAVGVVAGFVSGYYPRADRYVMRTMDALTAFPPILLALAIMAVLGSGLLNIVIALTIVYAPGVARVARVAVLSLRELEYVEAARSVGASDLRILGRHVLPNALSPITVQLSFVFSYALLAEASLSFLGLGTPPPWPSLGGIMGEGRVYVRQAPWVAFFPGLFLSAAILSLNMVGDSLRDLHDPRSRSRHVG